VIVNLWESSWPMERAGDAIQALASHAGLAHLPVTLPQTPGPVREHDITACHAWIASTAACLDIQTHHKQITYGSMPEILGEGPALLLVDFEREPRLLAVMSSGPGAVTLIPPNSGPKRIPLTKLRAAIGASLEAAASASLDAVLSDLELTVRERRRVLQSVVDTRLGSVSLAEAWVLDVPVTRTLWTHMRRAGVLRQLGAFASAYSLEYVLWIGSWILVGKWALEGRFDTGWLLGWALLLLTLIPVHMLAMWEQSKAAVSGAAVVMQLLLEGAFKLRPEEVKGAGVGQLLARVLDSEALQSLAMNGGLLALVAMIELIASTAILATVEAWVAAVLLLSWMALTVGLAFFYHRSRSEWTNARLDVTHELTERIVGHRTRLVQQPREQWHDGEDESLARYVEKSRRLDWLNTACMAVLPRGWLIAGIAAMAPGVIGESKSPAILAAQLGGILLAYNALRKLSGALATLSGAGIAVARARNILEAARRVEAPGDPAVSVAAIVPPLGPLAEIRDVTFRYPNRAADAVKHSSLKINPGERLLLQGGSGSGKSTWVALTSGVRLPNSGLLFLKGVDRKTLGDRNWRKRMVAVPQFHENHILTGSLAFNLLIGRGWPAEAKDLAEAETICRDLGLGELLDRMPAGLMQMVGDSGWQLSNGEKSRVFLGRALLQDADLILLDETFAALDPETARLSMDCVLRRAKTILCVAHV
jgi:ATP-binding cassette, subfamily B, bacterial